MDWPDIVLNIVMKILIVVAMPFIWAWHLLMEILRHARKTLVAIIGTAIAAYVIRYLLIWRQQQR